MSQKGVIHLTEIDENTYEVSATGLMEGRYLGIVRRVGKEWQAGNKNYKARDHAILALARAQNRTFHPRLSFHQSRIRSEIQWQK
jgi:hypothetical protein